MAKGIVAVVGRPNVGKSTFFNKLTGERISIVDDTPGVTRDRISADVEWNGRVLTLVDTGGIEPETNSALLRQMRAQAEMAIAAADVILFLTDLRTGVTDADREIATMLRKSKKPVLPVVNKVDAPGDLPADFYEFYSLGLGDPLPSRRFTAPAAATCSTPCSSCCPSPRIRRPRRASSAWRSSASRTRAKAR